MESKENHSLLAREKIWVLGLGKFGRLAIEVMQKIQPEASFVAVDKGPSGRVPEGVEFVQSDCIEWFTQEFARDFKVGKIIPSVPVHLAARWLIGTLVNSRREVSQPGLPEELLDQLPHAMRLSSFSAVTSHADFQCPASCSEPNEICSFTKRQRPEPLYHLMENMDCGRFVPIVIKSRQFAPGVGGFFPADLWHLLDSALKLPQTPLLIGTACKCHGVVDTVMHSMH